MKRMMLISALLLIAQTQIFGSDDAELNDLYSQAKRYFTEAVELQRDDPRGAYSLYQRSLAYYQRIVSDEGIENGRIYYNIGNIYFRTGDTGNAILNYLRAVDFSPNDPNLIRNLEYARSRRIDHIEVDERSTISRIIFFWHHDLNGRARFVVFLLAFLSIWIFAGIRLLLRKNGFVWAAGVGALIAAIMLASLSIDTIDSRRNIAGVVLDDEVVGRKGNSVTYQPSFQDPLHEGTEFTLREVRGDWLRVELADGRETWVPADSVGLVRQPGDVSYQ